MCPKFNHFDGSPKHMFIANYINYWSVVFMHTDEHTKHYSTENNTFWIVISVHVIIRDLQGDRYYTRPQLSLQI